MSLSMSAQNVAITGHRGASAYAPENTLAALQKAFDFGVDRIEVDVAISKDGVVICLHDETLDRTCQVNGDPRDFTWEELKKIKANKGKEGAFPEETIPSLEQAFELINGQCEFVIEIKNGHEHFPNIEAETVRLIRKFKAEELALVHSFNDDVLFRIHESDPDIRLQKLFVFRTKHPPVIQDFKHHKGRLEDYAFCEAFGVYRKFVKRKLIRDIHALGQKIHVWTVNDEKEMNKLIEWGVDGIISDKPDKVKQLLKDE